MKANKAPERIWINSPQDLPCGHIDNNSIEYTRTDVFIERAAKWVENNLSKYSELTDEDEYGNKLKEPVMNVFYGKAVKDFKNYMKGE